MRVRIQTTPTGAGGLLLEGSPYQFFLLGNKRQLVIFQGQVRGPSPAPLSPLILKFPTVWIYISTTYQGLSIPESPWTYVLPGLVNIHKLSANYISWRQRQRQHDHFLDQRDRSLQFRPCVVLRFGVARGGLDARKCTWHIKLSHVPVCRTWKQWPRSEFGGVWTHGRIQREDRGSGPPPLKNHKHIKYSFIALKKYKATKPAFNVGPSSARQRNAACCGIWILSLWQFSHVLAPFYRSSEFHFISSYSAVFHENNFY